jgi:hypothetical protein
VIYFIPLMITLLCGLASCYTFIKILHNFQLFNDKIQLYQAEEIKLVNCAQIKANIKNIEEAYHFLAVIYPQKEPMLAQIKDHLLDEVLDEATLLDFPSIPCTSPLLKTLITSMRKESPDSFPRHWPNWVVSYSTKKAH